MKAPLTIAAVFAVTFGTLTALALGLIPSPRVPAGEVTVTQLPDAAEEQASVQVARADFRPTRPF